MAFLEGDRRRLAYDRDGSGQPALVFVHGAACDRSHFRHQYGHFRRRHQVLSLDLAGHGESEGAPGPPTIDGYAEDVRWALAGLGIDRPIVVGHSMGGLVALRLATADPCPLRAAVLIDPAPLRITPELRSALEGLAGAVEAGDRAPLRGYIEQAWFIAGSPEDLRAAIVEATMAAPTERIAGTIRAILGHDVLRRGATRVPVLVVGTERPINAPALVSELLPSALVGQTVGTGHFAMLEAPAQVNDMIERFIEQRAAPAGSLA